MIKKSQKQKQKVLPINVSIPPSILINPTSDCVFRFVKTNAATSNINGLDFGSMLVFAISATVGYPVYEGIRLVKISAYGPASVLTSATGYANTVVSIRQNTALDSTGTDVGKTGSTEKTVYGYPTGGQGAYCHFKFKDPNNLWYEPWTLQYTSTVMQITGPVGTVVDVHCVIRMPNGTSAPTALASTGATTGLLYYNYLDARSSQYLQSVANANNKVWA